MAYKIKDKKTRKFKIYSTAFKGTKYAQESAYTPIIEARNVKSAIYKAEKGIDSPATNGFPATKIKINKSHIFKIEEV